MPDYHFLIVDDHIVTASGLKMIVEREFSASKCEIAQTVNEAYDLFDKNNYDLLILDMNIPGSSVTSVIDNILIFYQSLL